MGGREEERKRFNEGMELVDGLERIRKCEPGLKEARTPMDLKGEERAGVKRIGEGDSRMTIFGNRQRRSTQIEF